MGDYFLVTMYDLFSYTFLNLIKQFKHYWKKIEFQTKTCYFEFSKSS